MKENKHMFQQLCSLNIRDNDGSKSTVYTQWAEKKVRMAIKYTQLTVWVHSVLKYI